MTNVSGKKFTTKLTGKTASSIIQVACKFAFSSGMSVTKTFSYTIGDDCTGTGFENPTVTNDFFFPNPVQDILHLNLTEEENHIIITDLMGRIIFGKNVSGSYELNMSSFTPEIPFIRVENKNDILSGKIMKK